MARVLEQGHQTLTQSADIRELFLGATAGEKTVKIIHSRETPEPILEHGLPLLNYQKWDAS